MAKGDQQHGQHGQQSHDTRGSNVPHGITSAPPKVEKDDAPGVIQEPAAEAKPAVAPVPSSTPSAPLSPPTGRQLLDHLGSTHTPAKVLQPFDVWLADNPDSTAEQLYRHMESIGCDGAAGRPSQGTLRKACKFVYGDSAEPEALVSHVPGEEINRLRAENESLKKSLEAKDSQRAVLARQLEVANDAKNDAVRKLTILRGGKSKDELEALGIRD